MHARKIGKERPKVVPVGKRERKTHGRIKWIRICCGTGSGRERKKLGMPRCSGGQLASRVVSSFKEVFTTDKNGW